MASTLRNLAQAPAAPEADKQAQELPSVTESAPPVVEEAAPMEQPPQDESDTGGHVVTPEVGAAEAVEASPEPPAPEEAPAKPPTEKPKPPAKKKSQKAVTSEAPLEEKKEETE